MTFLTVESWEGEVTRNRFFQGFSVVRVVDAVKANMMPISGDMKAGTMTMQHLGGHLNGEFSAKGDTSPGLKTSCPNEAGERSLPGERPKWCRCDRCWHGIRQRNRTDSKPSATVPEAAPYIGAGPHGKTRGARSCPMPRSTARRKFGTLTHVAFRSSQRNLPSSR